MLQTVDRSSVTDGERTLVPSRLRRSVPPASVHVLVPAHNEEHSIGATIESLQRQTLAPASITVIADNCTDHTAGAAIIEGATVFTSVGNTQKKAGALNQYLRRALLDMDPDDFVLVMDADSALDHRFLEVAIRRLHADPKLGAVGGVFMGHEPTSILEQLQANEYVRYARAVGPQAGPRHGADRHGDDLPGPGACCRWPRRAGSSCPARWATSTTPRPSPRTTRSRWPSSTWAGQLVSPRECIVSTELMPTIGDLHRQRLRWYRGAVENLRTYGWTPVTRKYWIQQISLLACTFIFALFIAVTAIDLSLGILRWSPWWSAVSLLFLAERLVTVWRVGSRRGRLLAICMIPEAAYDLLLQVTFVRAAYPRPSRSPRGVVARHHHCTRTGVSCTSTSQWSSA